MSAPTKVPDSMPAARRVVDARTLNWLAEKADGVRDQTLALFLDLDGVHLEPLSEANQDLAILRVKTRHAQKKVSPPPKQIQIDPKWDAIFLTEAAVVKFLLPYYKAQRLLTKQEEEAFWREYCKDDVMGVIHIAPSVSLLLLKDGTTRSVFKSPIQSYVPEDAISQD